ncbi:hypothetical protein ACFVT2_04025 [Streptomyces sp. NPDC058000]|uniref:hypothetical protein n=1 Tax=Streptomyces sp. NPDC058000 TaxID=3346299 RepID=UPI0036E60568
MLDEGEPLVPDNRRSRHVPLRTGVIKYEYDMAMGGVEFYSEVLGNDPVAGSGGRRDGRRAEGKNGPEIFSSLTILMPELVPHG